MKKASWVIFILFSLIIGVYPAIYWLIDPKFGLLSTKTPELLANQIWSSAFYAHISFGGLALLIGWSNFISSWRNRYMQAHKLVGKVYILSVLLSGLTGMYVSFFATGGIISTLGFFSLSLIWLSTTIGAFVRIKQGNISAHQRLMIFSYAATWAAVTLRIWLPLLSMAFGDFIPAYRTVAWMCWVPNMTWAWWFTRKSRYTNYQFTNN
jgi:uncharacterized membrane protein